MGESETAQTHRNPPRGQAEKQQLAGLHADEPCLTWNLSGVSEQEGGPAAYVKGGGEPRRLPDSVMRDFQNGSCSSAALLL